MKDASHMNPTGKAYVKGWNRHATCERVYVKRHVFAAAISPYKTPALHDAWRKGFFDRAQSKPFNPEGAPPCA